MFESRAFSKFFLQLHKKFISKSKPDNRRMKLIPKCKTGFMFEKLQKIYFNNIRLVAVCFMIQFSI